ncbi:dihydroorotase [Pichia californica]|uniref:Dihydroorotase n=1 Tax=Pichia californica TaxID=460514 RepID=A0A9P6WPI7_9ASCO|nr:dihydroorotase [[Candida] californica]KAG0690897.1 dihydroorotase [[Candida] californica]
MSSRIELGYTADYHVHLRQGEMMDLVTPTVRDGGVSIAYIMPNLTPPITDIDRVVEYKKELQKLAPKTTFLMTFYLSKLLTPELVAKAADEGAIAGIKCYPAGVTTNSQAGVDPNDFTAFYPIFKVMEQKNLVLNLHGEKPSTHDNGEDIHVLNAEEKFLPALARLHKDFPNLKIVLEHCTSKAAIDAIHEINKDLKQGEQPKVVASLTAHHLFLTIDDWAGNPVNFCKPVAKLPHDRRALLDAAVSGKPYFFFGSDSAPHDLSKKSVHIGVCAGVYTQKFAIAYVAEIFDKIGKLDMLKDFVSTFGNAFYEMDESKLVCNDRCVLVKKDVDIPEVMTFGDSKLKIAPFRPVDKLHWSTEWI